MSREVAFDQVAALIERYDRPGPRYTSYPTAPAWTDDFGTDEFELELVQREASTRPLSLYVHVPFCHERCLYCGCNVVISKHERISDPYLDTLLLEIELTIGKLKGTRTTEQLHLGGGTPTYLKPDQLERLVNALRSGFEFTDDAEVSVEVDPGVTSVDHLKVLRKLGFNRISMGVQDLNPDVQAAVRREQSEAELRDFYEKCRAEGFESINVDLIYGLPRQTPETFETTVASITQWKPDRVALFSYAHVPWIKPHQKLMPEEALPGADAKLRIFLAARQRFLTAGYDAIGLDHFALHDDELSVARRSGELRRNFMGYTTKPETDSLAFGMSAISEVGACYAQNHSRLSHYQKAVNAGNLATLRGANLSDDDLLRRDVIMGLMCNTMLDKRRIEARHGIRFDETFAKELLALEPLVADGLVELTEERIEVTPVGQILLRNVAMVFDRYLPDDQSKALFSRTV